MVGAVVIVKVIQIVSILIAVFSIIFLGLQSMYGSAEGKAFNKKKLNILLTGVIFMSMVTAIVSSIFESIMDN